MKKLLHFCAENKVVAYFLALCTYSNLVANYINSGKVLLPGEKEVIWYPYLNFVIALALGLFIGLEREYAAHVQRGHDYAGIRTFPLIALFGALSAFFGALISIWLLIVGMLITGVLIIMAYFLISRVDRKHVGATSEVAGFLTFFLGVLSFYGEYQLAVVLTVIITLVLFMRSFLHDFAGRLKPKELASTLKFAVVAFVILPFLPNKGYGPYEIFNPYIFWLMVVFISGISFLGYIFLKWFGEKGIEMTGILGGLASSTAVTSSFAERSKKEHRIFLALALGVILANAVLFIRVLIEVFVLNQELFLSLLPALLLLFAVSLIFSYILWKKLTHRVPGKVELGSPFTLKPALKFGLLFAVVLALVKVAHIYFSAEGVYVVSFLSGLADVDAVTVSLANLARNGLALETAQNGILLAVLTNMAVKGGIAYWFGGKEFGKIVIGFFGVLIPLGIVLMILL